MGRPVPEDDSKLEELSAEETAALATDAAAADADNATADTDAAAGDDTTDATTDAAAADTDDLSEEALEAIIGENERAGWVPESRVKEIVADREAARRDAEQARTLAQQLLEERQQRTAAAASPPEKKRDFAAELTALKRQYAAQEIELDDYLDARDQLGADRARAEADERFAPVMQSFQTEAQRLRAEKLAADLDTAAKPIYAKFPFLDITSEHKNDEAIAAVIAVRDELIQSGVAPVRAMKLAAAEVGPEYAAAFEAATEEDDAATASNVASITSKRAAQARVAAINASNATPPATSKAGVGTKVTTGKIALTRSVEDHEKWEKMSDEQKRNVVFPDR